MYRIFLTVVDILPAAAVLLPVFCVLYGTVYQRDLRTTILHGLFCLYMAAAPTLLRLFGASDVTLPYAVSYARIYILGSVFVLTVMGMNVFITTQGFAKISMMTTVIGAVTNIILDPIFIFLLDMGVRGGCGVFSEKCDG